jgi:hypothetical protein
VSAETRRRVLELERELKRKDKALAETGALLELQGNAGLVRGRRRPHEAVQRRAVLAGIAEAQEAGAPLWRCVEVVGISERTVQRWRRESDGGEDRRRGPKTMSGNQLSEHEERRPLARDAQCRVRDDDSVGQELGDGPPFEQCPCDDHQVLARVEPGRDAARYDSQHVCDPFATEKHGKSGMRAMGIDSLETC